MISLLLFAKNGNVPLIIWTKSLTEVAVAHSPDAAVAEELAVLVRHLQLLVDVDPAAATCEFTALIDDE